MKPLCVFTPCIVYHIVELGHVHPVDFFRAALAADYAEFRAFHQWEWDICDVYHCWGAFGYYHTDTEKIDHGERELRSEDDIQWEPCWLQLPSSDPYAEPCTVMAQTLIQDYPMIPIGSHWLYADTDEILLTMEEVRLATVKIIHRQAMAFADKATLCNLKGDALGAKRFYTQALAYETLAADMLRLDYDSEPTRSVLYRSAASFAMMVGDWDKMERLIEDGLAGNCPDEIRDELLELMAKCAAEGRTYSESSEP